MACNIQTMTTSLLPAGCINVCALIVFLLCFKVSHKGLIRRTLECNSSVSTVAYSQEKGLGNHGREERDNDSAITIQAMTIVNLIACTSAGKYKAVIPFCEDTVRLE